MNAKKIVLFSGLFLIFGLLGCPKKPQKPPEVIQALVEPSEAKEEPSIRGTEFQAAPELKSIYFWYENYELTPEARAVLQKNAGYLKDHKELEVLIEGNCCECGTNEYNLALGQKRAQVTREYYINLGINPGLIGTISYGKEKPVKPNVGPPDSPDCSYNRHTDTKVRTKGVK
ncbi:MAG: OmpA family protein [Elusimicrobia bacterium]|nr:OmpA family protein [Elusimicrobiota bacterium]MBU2615311.1 OmpA family protein [Elusimicrobiota bacterium]